MSEHVEFLKGLANLKPKRQQLSDYEREKLRAAAAEMKWLKHGLVVAHEKAEAKVAEIARLKARRAVTKEFISEVEEIVGMGAPAWDMVRPEDLIEAVIEVCHGEGAVMEEGS